MLSRFLKKFTKTSGCWEWNGYIRKDGYANFRVGDKKLNAHRVAYELFVGPIPDGMEIDHLCYNRKCVNPDHLFVGTQRDNMMDMDRKGRRRWGRKKLTWEQVCEIRRRQAAGEKQVTLQREYGVSEDVILGIKKGRYWKRPMPEIIPWGS